ncbi:unnamed protein product [Bursaphelenchus xylophilus]|nr:unnamed protein product [Bursaphelenchus xylophilus]CAG9101974.1 unnamed protein product [Bursaphelenchus xylophilus]
MIGRLMQSVSQMGRRLLANPTVQQQRGFKVKKFPKLRCEHCYFIRIDGRLHVECHAAPKHKQREEFDIKTLW